MRRQQWFSAGLVLLAGAMAVLSCRLSTPARLHPPVREGENVRMRFHSIPAHAVPPCASCHVEPGVNLVQVDPALCGACHEDGVAQPDGQ